MVNIIFRPKIVDLLYKRNLPNYIPAALTMTPPMTQRMKFIAVIRTARFEVSGS